MAVRWRGVGPNHGSHTDAVVPPAAAYGSGAPWPSAFERQAGAAPGALAGALPPLLRAPADALPGAAGSPIGRRGRVPSTPLTAAAVLERAAADIRLPWPQPRAQDAARVHSDGDRDTWEQAAYARQRRLSRAGSQPP